MYSVKPLRFLLQIVLFHLNLLFFFSLTLFLHWQWCLWTRNPSLHLRLMTHQWMIHLSRFWWLTIATHSNCWKWAAVLMFLQLVSCCGFGVSLLGICWLVDWDFLMCALNSVRNQYTSEKIGVGKREDEYDITGDCPWIKYFQLVVNPSILLHSDHWANYKPVHICCGQIVNLMWNLMGIYQIDRALFVFQYSSAFLEYKFLFHTSVCVGFDCCHAMR